MSLQLDVKLLEGLEGKGQRIIRAKFRDHELTTRPAQGQNACYFGVELIWKVARRIEPNDDLIITAFDVSKYRPKKTIGSVSVNLAALAQRQVLNLEEPLVDANKMVTKATLSFDLFYRPPDQGEAGLDIGRFEHPLADLQQIRGADDLDFDDGEADGAEFGEQDNLMNLYGFGDVAGAEIDVPSEHSSDLSAPIRRDPKLKPLIDPTILKSETFTVSVTVVEVRELPGVNVNPMVAVTAAGKTRKTDIKFYTNNPYYNKFLSFEYFLPRTAVFDELIWIRVYNLSSRMIARILPGKLIGEFVIDVRTIYESKGHNLTNKWAVLIDPKKPLSGPQGYVRVDMAFLGKDDIPKHIKHEKDDEDISLEGNQLVPKGITNLSKRNITEFSVKVYRAEGLPPMNTDIVTSIKQAFVGESAPMCDPYVEVSFGGHSAKTKVKKFTYTPIWNQEIVFCDFFPPLTHTIRLCVRDWEAVKDETIATHLIDLKKILDKSSENVMPTFGPSWVNLYGAPRTYTYEQAKRPEDELNRSLGEGVAYRGRLLVAIKAQPSKDAMKTGAILRGTPPVSELVAGRKSPYLLFVAFYGISVVDPEIGNEKLPIQFEITIGNYGNKIDGKKGGILVKEQSPLKSETRARVQWDHSLTELMELKSDDGLYYHVDFGGVQPCLFLLSEFEDHRLRMCIPNIIEKLRTDFSCAMDQIHYLLHRRKPGSARHRLRQILLYKSRIFRKAANDVRSCRGTAPKTMLDLSYQRRVRTDLLRIEIRLKRLGRKLNGANLYEAIREANAVIHRLSELMDCPQHGLPDVFVSMVLDNKRIGFVRIPARDIYYSSSDAERGKLTSQVTTHFVRKPGHRGVGEKGWRIQCQLRMYTWLGLVKDYLAYKSGLPEGYDPECVLGVDPPKSLIYVDSSKFELRCYLYLAKNLLASNKTGFSDPMARVLIDNEMLETFPIYDTMSPLWDVTLIKTNITFYHLPEGVLRNPPQIIVEFFDVIAPSNAKKTDSAKVSNFLGRCFCEPNIVIKGSDYQPPQLQWWQIYRGQTTAGKLLASFDLIQIDALDDIDAIPTVEDLADFTRRFNERILLGPSCGIPFSDDSDDYEEYGEQWDDEIQQAARLFDEEAMAELEAPLDGDMEDTRSLVSAGTSGTLVSTATTGTRKKKKKAKVGLATADLVRWRADDALRLPENIRPPLGRYRLEVVFWGVRELRRQFLLPVNRPIITIEVGGTKVVSDLLRSAKINPLFEKRLKYVDLYLPLDEKLWPPITVMCHDHRMFGVSITVGLCTLPNPTDFFEKKDLEVYDEYESSTPIGSEAPPEEKAPIFSKALAGMGEPEAEELAPQAEDTAFQAGRYGAPQQPSVYSGASAEADEDSDSESGTGEKDSTAVSMTTGSHPGMYTERDPILKGSPGKPTGQPRGYDGPLAKDTPQAGIKTFPVNPLTKLSKQNLNTLDWWSRLFASLNDIDLDENTSNDGDSDEIDSKFEDNLENVELPPEDAEQDEEVIVAEIPEEVVIQGGRKSRRNQIRKFFHLKPKKELTALERFEKQKQKEKKKKAKKNKKGKSEPKILRKIRGDAKKAFLRELEQDIVITTAGIDPSLIERIKIYSTELEEVPEFQGFSTPIRNFKLFRGKQDDDDTLAEERAVGYFKGNIKLYPIPEDAEPPESVEDLHSFPTLPQRFNWRILVRCYIIRAFNLHPADPTGLADPYLVVSMGKQVYNDKSNYIPKTLRPTFGKMFQFEVEFPTTTVLHIEVMDHDILGSDDMIGQTVIDLESRFHSPHRATCGLAKTYYSHSYAQWRDSKLPTEILADLCKKSGIPPPVYAQIDNTVKVGGKAFYADTTIVDETETKKKSNEPLALAALNHWDEVPGGIALVPEHVEVRRLLHPEKGSLEQGRLMMWVDMFDRDEERPPPSIDVTPRTPEAWELRCIIYNTAEVVLNDTSLFSNEKSADIYVRGWVKGVGEDDQKTDVHYRSLSGEGNFNWRFVFPFNYMRHEDRIVFSRKKAFDLDPEEVKMPCDLTLQVWDNELVRSDKFLGSIALKLSHMPRPAKTPATCGLHQLEKTCPSLSLFENKQIRGWWPLVIKDDDEEGDVVQGKVEVELHLVSGQDAEASPVGKGHEEPEALPQPDRPDSSFMSFFGPLNTIRYLIKYKLKWILIKILIAFLILLIVFLLIYTSPGWISKKIWNA
uniref:Otoferlin n=1 Tax=Mesocestoides corti TaxID=53468 RepID=A0A5K3EPL3_MESCO